MDYLTQCKKLDLINFLEPWLKRGTIAMRADGKFVCRWSMGYNSPWHMVQWPTSFDCFFWTEVIFNIFSKDGFLGRPFVPSPCHNCYKVVVRPRTLRELFELEGIEERMGRPCKCGIEIRDIVPALYGGYFYNWGLGAGKECYQKVREAIKPEIKVILKRGCSEFELACGRSDKWRLVPGQKDLEKLIDTWFANDKVVEHQTEHQIAHVHRRWVEWAFKHGDETYLDYTGGRPLYPPAVTYHDKGGDKTDADARNNAPDTQEGEED